MTEAGPPGAPVRQADDATAGARADVPAGTAQTTSPPAGGWSAPATGGTPEAGAPVAGASPPSGKSPKSGGRSASKRDPATDRAQAAGDAAEASTGATSIDEGAINAGGGLLESARSADTGGRVSWIQAGFFAGLGLVAVAVLAGGVWSVRAVLVRVFVALFLAVSLDPAVRWLTRRGVKRGIAVALILAAFAAIVTAFLWSVIPPLVRQFEQVIRDVPTYIANLQRESVRFQELNERYDIASRLAGTVSQLPSTIGSGLVGLTGRVFGALANTLTVVVLTIYFMLDLPRLRRNVPRLAPAHRRARVHEITDVVIDKVGGYMIGQITISTIAGICALIALQVLDAAAPLPLAIVVGGFALIPLIGATLGATIAVMVTAFTTGLWPTAVILAIFFLLYQQLENYVIAPRVLRSAVDLSAAAVLLSGLIGATVLGLLGALMAIPTAAAVKVVIVQEMAKHEERAARAEQQRIAARQRAAEPSQAEAPATASRPPGAVERLAALARRTRRHG
jgi:predicted PurR-regulated permease PerM